MSLSTTAVQPGRVGPDSDDRSTYRRDAHLVQVTHSSILQHKLRWSGPKPPVRSKLAPRPTVARRGRDGLIGRSPARGGEVLRFRNQCSHTLLPPFESVLASIRRLASPEPLRRGIYRVVSRRPTRLGFDLAPSSIKQQRHALMARAHTNMEHSMRVDHLYARLRRQSTAP